MTESIIMAMRMSEKDTAALKEALAAQQKLLQKLYTELDVEREASSTAASEALSMILRLQGEKAAMKMEAEQYKRLAEEKMCYAEESMEIFEDLVYQKEMEVAALDYQVQSYKYKLQSLGYNDPGLGDNKHPDGVLQKKETSNGETSTVPLSISRRNSAPPSQLKFPHLRKGLLSESPDGELSTLKVVPEEHMGQEATDPILSLERHSDVSAADNINTYWEEIKKLDERVREIAGEQYANMMRMSKSPSQGLLSDAMKGGIGSNGSNQLKHEQDLPDQHDVATNCNCSPAVHDVFEVPQINNNGSERQQPKDEGNYDGDECQPLKDEGKLILEGDENKCEKPNSIPHEAIKSYVKEQVESLNRMLQAKHGDLNVCCKPPRDGTSVGCHLAHAPPTKSSTDPQTTILNKTSEIFEIHKQALAQVPTNGTGEEELRLLNAIQEQLNSIQSEIKSLKSQKSSSIQDDLAMLSLMEVYSLLIASLLCRFVKSSVISKVFIMY